MTRIFSWYRRTWYAYLIQLAQPLGGRKHKAEFYLGIAADWEARLHIHRQGRGAKMLACAVKRGIHLSVVMLWEFSSYFTAREFERWGKKSVKNHRKLLSVAEIPQFILEATAA